MEHFAVLLHTRVCTICRAEDRLNSQPRIGGGVRCRKSVAVLGAQRIIVGVLFIDLTALVHSAMKW